MGQKVNPIGFRLILNNSWDSRWFAKKDFKGHLEQDMKIRRAIKSIFPKVSISRIIIERFSQRVRVVIYTSKPDMFVGRKGNDIEKLNGILSKIVEGKQVFIKIADLKCPEIDAPSIADVIVNQFESRSTFPYRKTLRRVMSSAMLSGAKGIKILCSGRISGAEIARSEQYKQGCVPLHTIRANIDYASRPAHTTYGVIGVKVWVYKGNIAHGTYVYPEIKRYTGRNDTSSRGGARGGSRNYGNRAGGYNNRRNNNRSGPNRNSTTGKQWGGRRQ